MRIIIAVTVLLALHVIATQASENTSPLNIEISNPDARISIPGMPPMVMDEHPMHQQNSRLHLHGKSGNTAVSIGTPEIEAAVTPMACAIGVANAILELNQVSREQMFLGRANEHTFLIIYGLPMDKAVLLNTHVVSSDQGHQCIEAHISRISTSEADIEPWFNGFAGADISSP